MSDTTTIGHGDPTSLGTLEPRWRPAFAWVEELLDAEIVRWRRQARWRPAFFLDVTLPDGTQRSLYLRCQREESLPWTRTLSLKREFEILSVLQAQGVSVPHVHGFCEEPEAILMDAVDGRDRFDERDDEATRTAVLEQYMNALAEAHTIDADEFVRIGLRRPADQRQIGLMGFEVSEKWYRSVKPGPDPINEFIIGWLHRHVPAGRTDVRWLHFDAGQFLHDGGRMTAMIDVEFACLGDPLADLGAMRMRDTAQPIGDLTHAYAHYQQVTGTYVDHTVINFHAVRFALLTALLSVGARFDPAPEFDLAQWESWALMSQLLCLQIIAEEGGIDLAAEANTFEPETSRRQPWLLSVSRVLDDVLSELPDDDHLAFRLRIARDMAAASGRADGLAHQIELLDRDDEAALLGWRPRDWREADTALEQLVLRATPEDDAALVRMFHRRLRRQQAALEPAMRDVRDFEVQAVDWERFAASKA